MTKKSRFTTWDPNMWFKSTKVMKDQSNQSIFILIAHTWSHHQMMEPPKSGTPKKENYNTLSKPIPTTRSSVAKVIISSVEALKRQSTSGNADFMTQWRKRSSQASPLLVTWTTKRKSSQIQNPRTEKLMKDQSPKENFQGLNCVWLSWKILTEKQSLWCLTIKAKTLSFWILNQRKSQWTTHQRWRTCFQRDWLQNFRRYQIRLTLSQSNFYHNWRTTQIL